MKHAWIVVAAAIMAGCGGADLGTGYQGPGGGGGGPTALNASMGDYVFSPSSFTIKAGTAIKWTNAGTATHTVTSDSGAFDSGDLASPVPGGGYGGAGGTPGGSFQHTFSAVGVFPFHCAHHAQMTGTV